MPDPISHALASSIMTWAPGAPTLVRDAISLVGQFGIGLAVLLVVVGAWLSGGRTIGGFAMAIAPGLIAAAIAIVAVHVIGDLAPVSRPFVALGGTPIFHHAADASFPSDHVTLGMSMLGARIADRRLQWATVVVVLLVGLARVLAGVHWLDDIVAGAILGLACAWLGRAIWVVLAGRLRGGQAA
jgi:undecaprenyl-diphosphatase